MVRIARVGLPLILLLLGATALADKPRQDAPPAPQDPNQCTKATADARWVGMGYTHSVTLRNGCERPVTCTLWTDVDPDPKQAVQARPGESVEVVTRRGSPAREVTAFKSCTFR